MSEPRTSTAKLLLAAKLRGVLRYAELRDGLLQVEVEAAEELQVAAQRVIDYAKAHEPANRQAFEALEAALDAILYGDDAARIAVVPVLRAATPAPPEPGLDVERLAQAIDAADAHTWDLGGAAKWAEAIAAEYARLANPEPAP